jgi:hypothetical protein
MEKKSLEIVPAKGNFQALFQVPRLFSIEHGAKRAIASTKKAEPSVSYENLHQTLIPYPPLVKPAISGSFSNSCITSAG